MKQNLSTGIYGWLYRDAFLKGMKKNNFHKVSGAQLKQEYKAIISNAKDIGKSRMMSAYCMGAFFIAAYHLNENAEENYRIFRDGLEQSRIFKAALGNADAYLSEKKLAGRREWERESHKKLYENEWVVDVIAGGRDFALGYDYHECGICKLCADEGCFEIAHYLCRLDFLLAEMMGMKLTRTQTIADGADVCDFRYAKKSE
ncbi:MAG: L-2-amino-thiazoline-4-carboxylic acid hydrolase [Eubacteriales bacterium]|nr:L-2-amino-thiazoline-4-carboxylic acid hydrolase [Eubacteriales bacterium]